MISNCPHCRQALRLSDNKRAKLEQALQALDKGKHLSLKCPRCKQAIKINKEGSVDPVDKGKVRPPAPPDLDWLVSGKFEVEETVEDVPMAIVLHKDAKQRTNLEKSLKSVGYQVVTTDSSEDAIERMRFVPFACVVLQSDFEDSLQQSTFHAYMCKMPMERRRYIFYVLLGSQFHTLYDLEALAYSANVVVNVDDLEYFDTIIRKAIPSYEALFSPMLEELAAYGKR